MDRQSIIVKDSAFGRDMLEILMEKQLKQEAFSELDVPKSIVTLKAHLVNKFAPRQGEYPSELRFLYPACFDSARVLIAECQDMCAQDPNPRVQRQYPLIFDQP